MKTILASILLFSFFITNAQLGKIGFVVSNFPAMTTSPVTFILRSSDGVYTYSGSTLENHFLFMQVAEGTYKVTASWKDRTQIIDSILIRKGNQFTLPIHLIDSCPYDHKGNRPQCPIDKNDKIIPIAYGLLRGEEIQQAIKKGELYPGGCIVSDCDPYWYCPRHDKKL